MSEWDRYAVEKIGLAFDELEKAPGSGPGRRRALSDAQSHLSAVSVPADWTDDLRLVMDAASLSLDVRAAMGRLRGAAHR